MILANQDATTSLASCATDKNDMDEFINFVSNSSISQSSKLDIEVYLDDGLVVSTKSDFDILSWWNLNGLRHPVLYEIAGDILEIPVTFNYLIIGF